MMDGDHLWFGLDWTGLDYSSGFSVLQIELLRELRVLPQEHEKMRL
jgi:hypothetical protein